MDRKTEYLHLVDQHVSAIDTVIDGLGELTGEPHYLREAIRMACLGAKKGHRPIGAVIVADDQIVGRGHNQLSNANKKDPLYFLKHAEIDALIDYHNNVEPSNRPPSSRIMTVTTFEPCPMCTIAIHNAGIKSTLVGTLDKTGGQLISNRQAMPPSWDEMHKRLHTEHRLADVPSALREASAALQKIVPIYFE